MRAATAARAAASLSIVGGVNTRAGRQERRSAARFATFYTVGKPGLRQYAHGAPSTLRRRGARPARAQRRARRRQRRRPARGRRIDATARITGDVTRFKNQTGQQSQVRQAFLGWGQGQSYGSRFAGTPADAGADPDAPSRHGRPSRRETITPQGIASGRATGT